MTLTLRSLLAAAALVAAPAYPVSAVAADPAPAGAVEAHDYRAIYRSLTAKHAGAVVTVKFEPSIARSRTCRGSRRSRCRPAAGWPTG